FKLSANTATMWAAAAGVVVIMTPTRWGLEACAWARAGDAAAVTASPVMKARRSIIERPPRSGNPLDRPPADRRGRATPDSARAPPRVPAAPPQSHPAVEARVEEVAEPVADQVDAEDHREDREAGEQGEPPARGEVVAPLVEHGAPARRGG